MLSSSKCPYECSWTPQTTARLLLGALQPHDDGEDGKGSAAALAGWHVLDNVMTKRTPSCEGSNGDDEGDTHHDDDAGNGNGNDDDTHGQPAMSSFSNCLHRELLESNMLNKLRPARTQGDRRVDEVMDLLRSTERPWGSEIPSLLPTDPASTTHRLEETRGGDIPVGPDETYGVTVRGDKSLFVDREYRAREQGAQFATKHPYLHCLIDRVSDRIREEFCYHGTKCTGGDDDHDYDDATTVQLDLDLSLTSVQVAVYPGDGVSGYVRHCDRGHDSCRGEQQDRPFGVGNSKDGRDEPQRLITAVYYVTPDDWSPTLDGGALRLFHNGTNSNGEGEDKDDDHTDVIPYANRMVVFRSDVVEHQVLPSLRRPRTAVTMWFYGTVRGRRTNSQRDGNVCPPTTGPPHDVPAIPRRTESPSPPQRRRRRRRYLESPSPPPPPPLPIVPNDDDDTTGATPPDRHLPTIFVSIASYRDSEARPTLDSLFESALHPQRIFVGVVLQLMMVGRSAKDGSEARGDDVEDDERIWHSVTEKGSSDGKVGPPWMPHQVRYIRLDASDAMGPCYARGLCQTLYRGEDFVLQIDSHMRFRTNWDEYLIQSWTDCCIGRKKDGIQPHDKVLLTTYPVGYTLPNNVPAETRGTTLVPWKFDSHGMLRQQGRLLMRPDIPNNTANDRRDSPRKNTDDDRQRTGPTRHRCYRHHLYAGGFNFGTARAVIDDVPYDTMGLQHLFFGEELSMAVRFYTHGYDLYAPEETVCYHLWSRSHRPTSTTDLRYRTKSRSKADAAAEASRSKVRQQLLGEVGMIGIPYGLGTHRSASEFAETLGVDFADQTLTRRGTWDEGDFEGNDQAAGHQEMLRTFEEGSIEAKVASLDSKAQQLIGFFLQGTRHAV